MFTVTISYDGSATALHRYCNSTLGAAMRSFVHNTCKLYPDYLPSTACVQDCIAWYVQHGKSVTFGYDSD